MKFSVVLTAALAGQAAATWGFGKQAYNKWHETELERWLADHNIPYSKPADRKDLEKLVQDNWQTKVVDSYRDWPEPQLQSYLSQTGQELDKKQREDKNWLMENVKKHWLETEKTAETAWGSVKDWIFESWTLQALQSFLDRHNIHYPHPPARTQLVEIAKKNYDTIATKIGETSSYPGNWLYEAWTEQDLKTWLEEHGYPVPKRANREELISTVRRNSRWASLRAQHKASKVADNVFDTWSESRLKEFLDKYGVKIPQGSTKDELLALARRNKAYYVDETAASVTSGYNAATSSVSSAATQATDTAAYYKEATFDSLINSWSDSRLKAYLDSRGVPAPQTSKRDELLAKVRLHKHKAANGYGAWTFDTWTYDNLKNWLEARGQKVTAETAKSRDTLLKQATDYYNSVAGAAAAAGSHASASAASAHSKATGNAAAGASIASDKVAAGASMASGSAASAATNAASAASSAGSAASSAGSAAASAATNAAADGYSAASSAASKGGEYATDAAEAAYASVTSAIAQATATAKDAAFETWSDSDLKAYLDTYGINTYQGTTRNEMIAMARRNSHAFLHGSQDQGMMGQVHALLGKVTAPLYSILGWGEKKAGDAAASAGNAAGDLSKEAQKQAENAYAKAADKGEL